MISIGDILEIIVNSIIIVIQNGSSILAPVDFDLAYWYWLWLIISKEEFITQISNS